MERKLIREVKEGGEVLLKGWIYEIRKLGNLSFLILRDSSGFIQCVLKDDKKIKSLTLESVVEIIGKAKGCSVKARNVRNDVEVVVKDLKILNKSDELPIQINEKAAGSQLPTRLDYRYLDIRKPRVKAIFKIQSTIINSFREFFHKKGFIEIQPPSIIATSTEGGTELFKLKYFDREAFLAQSPQLYKQLCAISWEKVFCTGPVWRAEKHDTSKHINEIRQLDIEVAFCDDRCAIKQLEEVIRYIFEKIIKENSIELKVLDRELKAPESKSLTYDEAIYLMNKNGLKIKRGDDFEPKIERKLCSLFPEKIIFITDWPSSTKPFYIWPKGNGNSGGFDALYGGIEISSGGQRVHIPSILIKQLKERKLNPENFKWYIDAFRFGAPKHSGWSIGLERLTMAICGLDNIREATLFPRDRKRLSP